MAWVNAIVAYAAWQKKGVGRQAGGRQPPILTVSTGTHSPNRWYSGQFLPPTKTRGQPGWIQSTYWSSQNQKTRTWPKTREFHVSPMGQAQSEAGRSPAGTVPANCLCDEGRSSITCRPHSVLHMPGQRPARSSSWSDTGRVHGQQPILL